MKRSKQSIFGCFKSEKENQALQIQITELKNGVQTENSAIVELKASRNRAVLSNSGKTQRTTEKVEEKTSRQRSVHPSTKRSLRKQELQNASRCKRNKTPNDRKDF